MKAVEFVKEVNKGNIDAAEHTAKVIDECRKINKEYFYLNNISEELALDSAKKIHKKSKLAGLPVSVKDCISVKGVESRAGSKVLTGYKPLFDATVIERVKKESGVIISKDAQDEFGFGSFSTNVGVGFKVPLNPNDKERACGGSSGGSAGIAKKSSFPIISLAESTGGSIVCPASFCGVVGLCPTYGRVSRYGLIDYGNSLDKIGPIAKYVEDAALALEIISGYDKNESTTLDFPVDKYTSFVNKGVKGLKIGVIKENFGEGVDKEIDKNVAGAIARLEENGASISKVSLPLIKKYSLYAYYLLAMSEASTNLAKYCGMRYGKHEKLEGNFNEYFAKVRSPNFGEEAKRRIILGTYARMAGFRDAYYIKAMKVRTEIIKEYKKVFDKVDLLISPTMPVIAPKIKEIEKMTPLESYMIDILTCGPNLAGLPHISIPTGQKNGMPIGTMLIADHLQEKKLIQTGGVLEK